MTLGLNKGSNKQKTRFVMKPKREKINKCSKLKESRHRVLVRAFGE